ncbi:unnamed protein product [Pleuronectes platessa]|uniref:Uncharacterized protein n=1 Tax=Pleuronectes platessa TaxID=8262 RepID=A0A9N7U8B0_PLEPL|nr:unnamed protein product [Pleuronectes platessa]
MAVDSRRQYIERFTTLFYKGLARSRLRSAAATGCLIVRGGSRVPLLLSTATQLIAFIGCPGPKTPPLIQPWSGHLRGSGDNLSLRTEPEDPTLPSDHITGSVQQRPSHLPAFLPFHRHHNAASGTLALILIFHGHLPCNGGGWKRQSRRNSARRRWKKSGETKSGEPGNLSWRQKEGGIHTEPAPPST